MAEKSRGSLMTNQMKSIAAVKDFAAKDMINLRKKPRFGETIIQGFLFLTGILTILTTLGIVYGVFKFF